jgi:hypothetical protein
LTPALRAAITFSVFDSAVTMMNGVLLRPGSARTWRRRSKPVVGCMFQSEMTRP